MLTVNILMSRSLRLAHTSLLKNSFIDSSMTTSGLKTIMMPNKDDTNKGDYEISRPHDLFRSPISIGNLRKNEILMLFLKLEETFYCGHFSRTLIFLLNEMMTYFVNCGHLRLKAPWLEEASKKHCFSMSLFKYSHVLVEKGGH